MGALASKQRIAGNAAAFPAVHQFSLYGDRRFKLAISKKLVAEQFKRTQPNRKQPVVKTHKVCCRSLQEKPGAARISGGAQKRRDLDSKGKRLKIVRAKGALVSLKRREHTQQVGGKRDAGALALHS